jgi:glucosamine--fructose-6-phosphate aminotransferase (isomerizing)
MCGIIGYIGSEQGVAETLCESLEKLQYRGYDSCGVVLPTAKSVKIIKAIGSPEALSKKKFPKKCKSGLGHTRWATHGKVNLNNTHPHKSHDGKVYLVHNGVIENSDQIKDQLIAEGVGFYGETDSEVLANLIAKEFDANNDPEKALGRALSQVEGTYGIGVIFSDFLDEIYGARRSSPLIIGVGDGENFLSSDMNALPPRIKKVVYLEDEQITKLSKEDYDIQSLKGKSLKDRMHWKRVKNRNQDVELGDFSCFMEKEIFEQASAIRETFRGRFDEDFCEIKFGGVSLNKIKRVAFIGCGTAYHAGLLGKYYMENIADIPASAEYSSEYKYKNNPTEEGTLVVAISQSGETIDTLSAVKEARNKNYEAIAITNTVSSTIAREVDEGIYQRIGPEISVASTKAFSSQCVILLMLAILIGRKHKLNSIDSQRYIKQIRRLPNLIEKTLLLKDKIRKTAAGLQMQKAVDFLGRQYLYPIALEGALKLKELCYVDAHGYASGEIKHGPLAMIRRGRYCIYLGTQRLLLKKNISNLKEIKSRNGKIVLISQEGLNFPKDCYDYLIEVPKAPDFISPILSTIPLQLFSMYMAQINKRNVDKPRNLAKSVTVE